MNQFAQLLSAERQTVLLLDTCTIISAWQKKPEALAFRAKIARRKDIRIIVPRILVGEVAKVAGISRDDALSLAESFSEFGQIEYLDDPAVSREADSLAAKNPAYCHYPDNHYLVNCTFRKCLTRKPVFPK